jgi:hypothetical protein
MVALVVRGSVHEGDIALRYGLFVGKNNKARRAAKGKAKRGRSYGEPGAYSWDSNGGSGSGWRPPVDGEPLFTQSERALSLLLLTAQAQRRGDRFASDGLGKLLAMPAAVVDREAEAALLDQVDAIWSGGWQPAELLRQGRLGCSTTAGARLVGAAIATDHAGRRSVTLDGRWIAQVEGLDLPAVNGRPGWISRWVDDEGFDRPTAVAAMVNVLDNLLHLPRLESVLPPPGSGGEAHSGAWPGRSNGTAGAESDPILVRIRALLAKAESSTFEAEATAFTAKAQELMTRHAVDVAVVHSGSGHDDEEPVSIRVPFDAPYADVKSLLLQTVAEASRCRSVVHLKLAMSTVVGFPADVAAVELLFTSLLLQAQRALGDAAKRAPAGTRTRSQSYRSAFLLAYTGRIGDRLNEINDAVFAQVEAEQGSAFLPVLRSRSASVDDVMSERFGETVRSPVRGGYDAAGWASGRSAADHAQLNFGDLTDGVATGT